MTSTSNPILIDLPMPIETPRLTIRPKQPGDGAETSVAVHETWDSLHQWMEWAENPDDHTPEKQEIRTRQMMAAYVMRETIELLGIERATGQPVIWCGFHDVRWRARQCDTGYWVRKSAQNRGFATEATNALLRYAFSTLGMNRVGIRHAEGNGASRRVIEKLGFTPEGALRSAAHLPGGCKADMLVYGRLDAVNLPPIEVTWPAADPEGRSDPEALAAHLEMLERSLLDPGFRRDREAVDTLLAGDFREFGSSGQVFTRPGILTLLAEEDPLSITLSDFRYDRLAEDTALITYCSHRHSPDGTTSAALRSSVWVHRTSGWQLLFHQGTKIPLRT